MTVHDPINIFISLSAFLFAYAEIHFRIGKLVGILYKKEPEIIFDLPFRSQSGKDIPLFLFIKDAHIFPVKLQEMTIRIKMKDQSTPKIIRKDINLDLKEKFVSRIFELPSYLFPAEGFYEIDSELIYQINGKIRNLHQDNYRSISHEPFEIYISNEALPSFEGWHWGDLHVHSNFTDDQVEFGAPIEETIHCARSIGLDFVSFTDHSFDFEDVGLNSEPTPQKWEDFSAEINLQSKKNSDFILLPGEEVSTGNHLNQNVHCLVIGNENFYPGSGDGAKVLFKNKPTIPLTNLVKQVQANETNMIIAAAHPGDIPPQSQKIVLNRGCWNDKDLLSNGLDYWQILNGKLDNFFLHSLQKWKEALLDGYRIGILAGTDAHGNFNSFRQIKTPLIQMTKHRQQLLGLTRSGVFVDGEFNRSNLLNALKNKQVVISNGPIITIEINQDEQRIPIGGKFKLDKPFSIRLRAKSSEEFGKLSRIYLYNGCYRDRKEHRIVIKVGDSVFTHEEIPNLSDKLKKGYIRAEVYTDNGQWHYFCLTNPVWIE